MSYLSLIIILLMILTLSVVVIGVAKLRDGRKISAKRQNKLMVLRIVLQATVVIFIGIIYYFSNPGT